MAKRAFLVVGPESSCTRLVTGLFVRVGCAGTDAHEQPLDAFIEGGAPIGSIIGDAELVTARRSVPHGLELPDLSRMDLRFLESGYSTLWVVLHRDWFTMARSQVQQNHRPGLGIAESYITKEYEHIFQFILERRPCWFLLSTSHLFLAPQRALHQLEMATGFKFDTSIIRDADQKYY